MKRVCIVGGGPAGLSAAIHAAREGAAVALRERNDRLGAKLLATGGGRCNVTNNRPAEEWPPLFGRRGRFIVPAMSLMPRSALADWFAALGQPLASPDGFHLFPESESAMAVRDALAAEALRLGVAVERGRRVRRIEAAGDGTLLVGGDIGLTPFEAVVVATGGRSWPVTGSTGDGWDMARELGHRIAPAFPGLIGLRATNLGPELAGLVLEDAEAVFKAKGRGEIAGAGELLVTHGGVSGPAILDLSASVAEALAETGTVVLRLRWKRGMDRDVWLGHLSRWRGDRGGLAVAALLREFLPTKLARWLCAFAGLPEGTTAANLAAAGRDRLLEALAAFPARVVAGEGWEKAMITRGGVDVRDVDPETLGSRLVSGLFFAGETLDVDGPCGGYNLHWAFASGALAGMSAAR